MFIESIRLALSAIRANKMRSFLTMLGIIIGISSVISITSIGAGAEAAINQQFQSVGTSYLYIQPNWEMIEDAVMQEDLFVSDEIDALAKKYADDIAYIAPYVNYSGTALFKKSTGDLRLTGVNSHYNDFYKMDIEYGRMIGENDVKGKRNNIVISDDAAMHFFNKKNAVGKILPVTINNESYDMNVIGVYSIPTSIFSSLDTSTSYSCYIPYSTLWNDDEGAFYIEIYTKEGVNVDQKAQEMADYMTLIKGKEKGFYTFDSAAGQMEMISSMLTAVSLAIGAIAAISLLVGGIGIMNIMLVSVTERTREIGIRKALGARTRDILLQFLVESMIISAIGGAIGTLIGAGIPSIAMILLNVPVTINPATIIGSVLFSAAVGMFFGLFPAKKAAKLNPIDALRYE